ncbi:hypothetical protein [Hymenobacter terrenus]|uniref:hypothetical protein n=1 Tax=Hymenobacter terrenus TaxID=1629124 RepID=UPI0012E07701|nr:hypothetical protein [Hymenobacter terrenus]
MKVQLFAGLTYLGLVESKIIDDSMGVAGGLLEPTAAYYNDFQYFFQAHTEKPDWARLANLELKEVSDAGEVLHCCGGICVVDVEKYDEIEVEFCGIGQGYNR